MPPQDASEELDAFLSLRNDYHISGENLIKFIDNEYRANPKSFIDYIHLGHHKAKRKYPSMINPYLPILNPKLLDPDTVMAGFHTRRSSKSNRNIILDFYRVEQNGRKKKWEYYIYFDDKGTYYLDIDFLYHIYGDVITKINGKDIRNA